MKLNPGNFALAIAVSALIAYAFHALAGSDPRALIVSVGSFATLASTLSMVLAVSYARPRTAVNLRIVCGGFFAVFLAINVLYSTTSLPQAAYLVTTGLFIAAYVIAFRVVLSTDQ